MLDGNKLKNSIIFPVKMAFKTINELLLDKHLFMGKDGVTDCTIIRQIAERINPSYIRHAPGEGIDEAKKRTLEESLESRIPESGGDAFQLLLVCDKNHHFPNQVMRYDYDPFGIYTFKGLTKGVDR